ncbi:MAG: DNA-processing protein DprA [Bacteroidia bacterium]
MNEELLLIALTQTSGIGVKLIQKLRRTFSGLLPLADPQNHKKLPPPIQEKLAKLPPQIPQAQKIFDLCQREGIQIIPFWADSYPSLLKQASQFPPVLYVRGKWAPSPRCISIVGTRKATPYGIKVSKLLSETLAARGYVLVSGLAYGIDTQVHKSAIEVGGNTWAVLAHGLDKIYPPKNKELAHQIAHSGALITEYPPGTALHPLNFPYRNRIIAGLSLATIIVESDLKGGAMTTAQWAFHMNRQVYAVPGAIFSPQSRGTHDLIQRQMAEILASPQQILQALESELPQLALPLAHALPTPHWDNPVEKNIYEAIPTEGIAREDLAMRVEMPFAQLSSWLTIMEVKGLIALRPGGMVFRA